MYFESMSYRKEINSYRNTSNHNTDFIKRKAQSLYKKDDRSYKAYLASKFHFAIPLKPQDKPAEFPPGFTNHLRNEYAIKYLETIGATPSPENIKEVLKSLPIEQCRVTAAWKSRGWLADFLYITPHELERKDIHPPVTGPSKPIIKLKTISKVSKGLMDREDDIFLAAKNKYLYPFNKSNHKHDLLPKLKVGNLEDNIHPRGGGGGSDKIINDKNETQDDDDTFDNEDMRKSYREIQTPVSVTDTEIKNLLKLFTDKIPNNILTSHGSKSSQNESIGNIIRSSIVCPTVIKLIGLLCHYLYWTILRKHIEKVSTFPSTHDQILTGAIIESFGNYELMIQSDKDTRSLHNILPLMILSLRVVIEQVFRKHYSLWFSYGGEGIKYDTLGNMNEVISSLLDTNGYYSRISTIQSSNDAMRATSRLLHSNKDEKHKFKNTSKIIRSVFPHPNHGEVRHLLNERNIKKLPSPIRRNKQNLSVIDAGEKGEKDDDLNLDQRIKLYKIAMKKLQSSSRNHKFIVSIPQQELLES